MDPADFVSKGGSPDFFKNCLKIFPSSLPLSGMNGETVPRRRLTRYRF